MTPKKCIVQIASGRHPITRSTLETTCVQSCVFMENRVEWREHEVQEDGSTPLLTRTEAKDGTTMWEWTPTSMAAFPFTVCPAMKQKHFHKTKWNNGWNKTWQGTQQCHAISAKEPIQNILTVLLKKFLSTTMCWNTSESSLNCGSSPRMQTSLSKSNGFVFPMHCGEWTSEVLGPPLLMKVDIF